MLSGILLMRLVEVFVVDLEVILVFIETLVVNLGVVMMKKLN